MTGSFTGRAVAETIQKYICSHPVEVEVMNNHDVIMGHMIGLAKWPRSAVYFPLGKA